MRTRLVVAGLAAGLAAAAILPAAASGPATHTAQKPAATSVGVVQPLARALHARFAMNQSNNWSGYNKGALESGGTTFHSVSGEWVVPTATAARHGEDEYSSSWVGIGGGCIDANCVASDNTLIQAGTEQDVSAAGKASYSTWYELIPAPSFTTPLAVKPGNTVSVTIAESVPELWSITLKNVSTGQSWSTSVPYPSDYSTAEWIEETPLVIGSTGFAPMPKLGTVHFDKATVNGANAGLTAAEGMQLVDPNSNKALATPSAPDAQHDGFNDCTYATTCKASSR